MVAAAARKRPAPGQEPNDGTSSPESCKKRPRNSLGSIDDYERLEVLGEGAYSVVFKARHRRTGKEVAVKWVRGEGPGGHGPPDRAAVDLEHDCQAACCGHPSIVRIEDVVADAKNGDVFLVMELVGPSLFEQLGTPFSEDSTRAMMRQLVGAAKKMHDAGIIHRDIKPDNVLVSTRGELKICDFGSATPLKPAGEPYEEVLVGTLLFNSPEQLADSRYYGTAVDMWALGCVMFELLTGDPLFDGDTAEDVLQEVVDLRDKLTEHGASAFEDLPELSPEGRDVLAGLLAFDPEERLTAAAALQHRWFAEEAESPVKHPGFVPLGMPCQASC